MSLRYQLPKGKRIKSGRVSYIDAKTLQLRTISAFGWVNVENHWWVENESRWVHTDEVHGRAPYCSSFHPCRSIRSFRRHLRHWNRYLPKGTKVSLISRFDELCVTAITTGRRS